jgi:hypothetical protein
LQSFFISSPEAAEQHLKGFNLIQRSVPVGTCHFSTRLLRKNMEKNLIDDLYSYLMLLNAKDAGLP